MRVRRQAPSILSLKTLFSCVHLFFFFRCLNSHSLQRHSYFLMPSIFLFCCSHGSALEPWYPPPLFPPLFFFFFFFFFYSSLCALVLTNSYLYFISFGMEQALCATTARLRVPCRVLSWPPILWTKSSRLCEAPTALNDWLARASDVPMCGNLLQTVGVLGLKKN